MYDCTGRPTGLLLVALWELPAVRLARSHSLTDVGRAVNSRRRPLPTVTGTSVPTRDEHFVNLYVARIFYGPSKTS